MTQTIVSNDLIFEPEHLTKETIKKYLCQNATDQELMMGLQIAKTFKLNPLKREVYFIKYKDDQPMQVLTGYEVYLKRAEKSGLYAGLETTTEGNVADGSLKAIVKIYRKDWERPLVHEAYYSEYVQNKKDFKTGKIEPNTFWKNKPKTMIKKVAESQGFRKAFPCEFDGMPYTSDEVVDQEKVIDVNPSQEKALSNAPTAEQHGQTKATKQEGLKTNPSDEQRITNEQGNALIAMITKNGWTKDDLKEFIFFEFELDKLGLLCNKHLLTIKEHFSKVKEVKDESN